MQKSLTENQPFAAVFKQYSLVLMAVYRRPTLMSPKKKKTEKHHYTNILVLYSKSGPSQTFWKKTSGPAVFRFSHQQKYFSEKREKLVAVKKKVGHTGDPSSCNIELCFKL